MRLTNSTNILVIVCYIVTLYDIEINLRTILVNQNHNYYAQYTVGHHMRLVWVRQEQPR